ncbi:MAG: hypothetical protein IJ757_06660 [Clostridiales bacterium]|nr:hypothetical protein [Clostridiales bacterium]
MSGFFGKHKLLKDALIVALICVLMLVVMEIRQPYFFLQDDNCDAYICQYVHSLRSVAQGEFPYYNFHQLGGTGFLDKGQTGQLNPFVYAGGILSKLFLGHLCGTCDFTAALYLTLGAVGMMIYLEKRFRLQRYVTMIGAIAWSFNSFTIYCGSNWMIAIIVTGLLPWIFLGTMYLQEHDGLKALVIAAIPKVLLFYGGHPQYFVYAVIFDFLFALTWELIFSGKGLRLKSAWRLTRKYFVSGLLLTLWSLPLLGPMYRAMKMAADRSGTLGWDDFIVAVYKIKDLIRGLINPLVQNDITRKVLETGEEVDFIDELTSTQKNMSHIGFILVFSALLGLVHIILNRRRVAGEKLKQMYALIPVGVITFLWASTTWFNRIIYRIPVLNYFRYPFKVMLFFVFFLICLGCITLEMLIDDQKTRINNMKFIKVSLVAIECVNLFLLYILLPVRYFGVYTNSPIPFEEPWIDDLRGSRYVTVMDRPYYWELYSFYKTDEDGYTEQINHATRVPRDTAALLSNNYATYYGIDNICGYDLLTTVETTEANQELISHFEEIGGSVGEVYEDMIPSLRARAVKYYVTIPDHSDEVEEELAPYGIVRFREDDNRVIFADPLACARAYANGGSDEVQLEEHVNYLKVTTPEVFAGGSVTVCFNHDRRFVATVDGQAFPITDRGDHADMTVSDVPAGSHEVIFRFVDRTFRNCVIFTLAVTALLFAGHRVFRRVKNNSTKS